MRTGMKPQKNRRELFGYKICDGERVIHETEGLIVSWAYTQYCNGFSYLQIADKLKEKNIPYRADGCSWNKNMVQRMLAREEYCGENGYPKLIERELYEKVQSIKQRRVAIRAIRQEVPKEIRQMLRCGKCGSGIEREKAGKVMNWQCRVEKRTTEEYITDEVLLAKIVRKTNEMIAYPEVLETQPEQTFKLTLSMMQANNHILRQIQEQKRSAAEIQQLIFQAAAERYRNCRTEDATYYTKQLLEVYGQEEIKAVPDFKLLQHTVKHIYLNPDGELQFEMINGKII